VEVVSGAATPPQNPPCPKCLGRNTAKTRETTLMRLAGYLLRSALGQRVKGAAKDGIGAVTGNASLEREGERENAQGRA
jgi:hypothetical protein